MNTYTCDIREDPETGEAIVDLPPEMMAELGWKSGDDIIAYEIEPGRILMTRKKTNIFENLRNICMRLITRVRAPKNDMD